MQVRCHSVNWSGNEAKAIFCGSQMEMAVWRIFDNLGELVLMQNSQPSKRSHFSTRFAEVEIDVNAFALPAGGAGAVKGRPRRTAAVHDEVVQPLLLKAGSGGAMCSSWTACILCWQQTIFRIQRASKMP